MGNQNSETVLQDPTAPTPIAANQQSILNEAAQLYNQGIGTTPYPGSTYVPMSQASLDALAQIEAIARTPNPMLGQANATVQQLLASGGLSPNLLASLAPLQSIAGGQQSVGTQSLYDQIFGQASQPSAASNYLSGIASGSAAIGTPTAFADILAAAGAPTAAEQYLTATARGDYLAQPNPYLQQIIDDRSQQIANQVKDIYSGMGRYGSSALNRDLTDRLAQFQAGVLSDNWEAERARQMQACDMIDAANWQRLATQYQAALGQTNAEAANIENRIGAARAIDTSLGDMFGAQLSAAGGLTNARATDIDNIFGAAGSLADYYSGGLNRALSAANAAPGLADAAYGSAYRLGQVGMARESDQAAQLADLVAQYNFEQRAPMDALAWLNALVNNAGSFSPTVAPPTVTQSPWFSALG